MANLRLDIIEWLNKYGTDMSNIHVFYDKPNKEGDNPVIVSNRTHAKVFKLTRESFDSYAGGGLEAFKQLAKQEKLSYALPEKYLNKEPYMNHKTFLIENISGVDNPAPEFKVWNKIKKQYAGGNWGGSDERKDFIWKSSEDAAKRIDIWVSEYRDEYLMLKEQQAENAFGKKHPVFKAMFDEMFIGYIIPLKYFVQKNKPKFMKKTDEWGWTTETLLMSEISKFQNITASFKTKKEAERYAYEYGVDAFGDPAGENMDESTPLDNAEPKSTAMPILSAEDYRKLEEQVKNNDVIGNIQYPCEVFVGAKVFARKGVTGNVTGKEGETFQNVDQAIQYIVGRGYLTAENINWYQIKYYDGSAEGKVLDKEQIARRIAEIEAEKQVSVPSSEAVKWSGEAEYDIARNIKEMLFKGLRNTMMDIGANDFKYGQELIDGRYMVYGSIKARTKNYNKGFRLYVYYNSPDDNYIIRGIVTIGDNTKDVGMVKDVSVENIGFGVREITDGEKKPVKNLISTVLQENRDTKDELNKISKLIEMLHKNFADSIKYHDTDFLGMPKKNWMQILVQQVYTSDDGERSISYPNLDVSFIIEEVEKAFASGEIYNALWSGAITPKDAVQILKFGGIAVPEEYIAAAEVQQNMIDKESEKILDYLNKLSAVVVPEVEEEIEKLEPVEFKSVIIQPPYAVINDLLGDKKPDWMQTREQFFKVPSSEVVIDGAKYKYKKGKLREGQHFYESKNDWISVVDVPKTLIEQAQLAGDYAQAINDGRMTPFDAVYIMRSAGVTPNDDILKLAGITPETPTIIGRVLDLDGEKKAGWMMTNSERKIVRDAIDAELGGFEDLSTEEYNRKVTERDERIEPYRVDALKIAMNKREVLSDVVFGKLTAMDAVYLIQLNNLETRISGLSIPMDTTLFRMAYEESVRAVSATDKAEKQNEVRQQMGSFTDLLADRLNEPKQLWMLTREQFEDKAEEAGFDVMGESRRSKERYCYSPAFRSPEQIKDGVTNTGVKIPSKLVGGYWITLYVYLMEVAKAMGKDLKSIQLVNGFTVETYPANENLYVKAIKEGRMTVQDVKDIFGETKVIVIPDTILSLEGTEKALEVSAGSVINSTTNLLGEKKDTRMMLADEYYDFEKARMLADAQSYDVAKEVKQTLDKKPKFNYRIIGTSNFRTGEYAARLLAEQAAFLHVGRAIKDITSGENGIKEEFQKLIRGAIKEGYYQEAIKTGRMSALDAVAVIESAGWQVPPDIIIDNKLNEVKDKEVQLQVMFQSFSGEWGKSMGIYPVATDDGYELRMRAHGEEVRVITYNAVTNSIAYPCINVDSSYVLRLREKETKLETIREGFYNRILSAFGGSLNFKNALTELFIQIWEWSLQNGNGNKVNSDKAAVFMSLIKPFADEYSLHVKAGIAGDKIELRHTIINKVKILITYDMGSETVEFPAIGLDRKELEKYHSLSTVASVLKNRVTLLTDLSPNQQKDLVQLCTEIYSWLKRKPDASSAEKSAPTDMMQWIIKNSAVMIKAFAALRVSPDSTGTDVYSLSVHPRNKKNKENILWYSKKNNTLLFDGTSAANIDELTLTRLVKEKFGSYPTQFSAALMMFYKNILKFNEFDKPTRIGSTMTKPRQMNAKEMDLFFNEGFLRGNGKLKASDIEEIGNRLNDDERSSFFSLWMTYMRLNKISLGGDGYYTKPIAVKEAEGIKVETLSKTEEKEFIKQLMPTKSTKMGWAVKCPAYSSNIAASWGYFDSNAGAADYVQRKNVDEGCMIFYFNFNSDILSSKRCFSDVEREELGELIVTPQDVPTRETDYMLTPDKYDLRVAADGVSDLTTMFRNFFIKMGGKVRISFINNYINGLEPVMKKAYEKAWKEYRMLGDIEVRDAYCINTLLYEEPAEREGEQGVSAVEAVNAVVEASTEDQKTIVLKTAKTSRRGYVIKMDAEAPDTSSEWVYADSPLMVVRTMEAHQAESSQVFYFDKVKNTLVNAIVNSDWDEEQQAEVLEKLAEETVEEEQVVAEKQVGKTQNILSSKESKKVIQQIKEHKKVDMSFLRKYNSFTDVLADSSSPYHLMDKKQKLEVEKYFEEELAEAEEFAKGGEVSAVTEVDGVKQFTVKYKTISQFGGIDKFYHAIYASANKDTKKWTADYIEFNVASYIGWGTEDSGRCRIYKNQQGYHEFDVVVQIVELLKGHTEQELVADFVEWFKEVEYDEDKERKGLGLPVYQEEGFAEHRSWYGYRIVGAEYGDGGTVGDDGISKLLKGESVYYGSPSYTLLFVIDEIKRVGDWYEGLGHYANENPSLQHAFSIPKKSLDEVIEAVQNNDVPFAATHWHDKDTQDVLELRPTEGLYEAIREKSEYKFENGGDITNANIFNVIVKYIVGQADIDTKGILIRALNKTNNGGFDGEAILTGGYGDSRTEPHGDIELKLIESKYGEEVFQVKYNIDKDEFDIKDDAEKVFNFVKERINNITYYSYRSWDDIDTPKKAKIDIVSVERAVKMEAGGVIGIIYEGVPAMGLDILDKKRRRLAKEAYIGKRFKATLLKDLNYNLKKGDTVYVTPYKESLGIGHGRISFSVTNEYDTSTLTFGKSDTGMAGLYDWVENIQPATEKEYQTVYKEMHRRHMADYDKYHFGFRDASTVKFAVGGEVVPELVE